MIQDALNQLLVLGAVGARTSTRYQTNQQLKGLERASAANQTLAEKATGRLQGEAENRLVDIAKQKAELKPSNKNIAEAEEIGSKVYEKQTGEARQEAEALNREGVEFDEEGNEYQIAENNALQAQTRQLNQISNQKQARQIRKQLLESKQNKSYFGEV